MRCGWIAGDPSAVSMSLMPFARLMYDRAMRQAPEDRRGELYGASLHCFFWCYQDLVTEEKLILAIAKIRLDLTAGFIGIGI